LVKAHALADLLRPDIYSHAHKHADEVDSHNERNGLSSDPREA
jgi:hypothetical protein